MKKLDCDKTREALAAYLDGDNAALQSVDVQAHLAVCADCQAVFAQVEHALALKAEEVSPEISQNHAAHPDAQYWNDLPDRVMARLEGQSGAKGGATPVIEPPPKKMRDMWLIKTLTASKTGSLLALTAVVFLVVVITRTMQDSLPEAERFKALPDAQTTVAERAPAAAEEKSQAQPPALETEQTPAKEILTAGAREASSESKLAAKPAETSINTTGQVAAPAEQAAPAPQAALSGEQSPQLDDRLQRSEDKLSFAEAENAKKEAPVSAESSLMTVERFAAEDRQLSKADQAAGAALRSVPQSAPMRAMRVSGEGGPSPGNSYSQALWRAQQAATPEARQIIWQDFLSVASDSIYIKLGIAQLAQSMLAQVDSNSTVQQLKSTLRFLELHETVLREELGVERLSSEIRRVKLLQGKK